MFGFDYDPADAGQMQCPDCGQWFWPEVGMGGHLCQQSIDRSRRETEESNARYEGSGQRIKIKLEIEIECFDTDEALAAAETMCDLNGVWGRRNGSGRIRDDLLKITGRLRRTVSRS